MERGIVGAEGAEDFVGGDMVEVDVGDFAGGFKECECSEDVGFEEFLGALDGAIDVAFCSEVDDEGDVMMVEEVGDELGVADIADDEVDHGVGGWETFGVAGVGECIEDDDLVFGVIFSPVMNEVGADESGSACDEDIFHDFEEGDWI